MKRLWPLFVGIFLILLGYASMLMIDVSMPLEEVITKVKLWNLFVFLGAGLILYYIFKRR